MILYFYSTDEMFFPEEEANDKECESRQLIPKVVVSQNHHKYVTCRIIDSEDDDGDGDSNGEENTNLLESSSASCKSTVV